MKLFKKIWPFLIIFFIWLVLFRPFWLKGLLPIPADIITGVYYPWLDYKWGFAVGVPVKNPLISDIPSLLYPWRSFAIDQLKLGHWPLWNPYYFGGMPLLANFQSAVFSYINILFLFFSKPIAWSLGVMASPLLTMLAMYLFLRYKRLSNIPSLLGAVVFSLSGFQIAWLEYNVHGHTALFLPLLLLAIDKFLGEKNKKWLALLPLLVSFQIFTGYLPIVIYSYLLCAIYIIYFYFWPDIRNQKIVFKKYILLAFCWIWGLALASVQLLPGWELTKNSVRTIDQTVSASHASTLPLKNLITFLAPDFFGNPATGNYFGTAFYDNFYLFVGTGTLLLVLATFGLIIREKQIRFWWLLAALSFILITNNPLGVILEKILFLSGGVAARALFITDFSLAVLAAFGLNAYLNNKIRLKGILLPVSIIFCLLLVSFVASLGIIDPGQKMVAQRNLVLPVFFAFSSVFVLIGGKWQSRYLKISSLVFLFLTTIQLLYSAGKYLPFSDRKLLFPKTPVIEYLIEQKQNSTRPFRVELGEVIPQNFLMPYGIETTSGYDALLPRRTGEFITLLETSKVADRISRVQLVRNYDSPLFPLVNTRYLLAKKMDKYGLYSPDGAPPARFSDPRYRLVFEDKTVQVYEDSLVLPRAALLSSYQVLTDKEFVEKFMEIDFSKTVILEKELPLISSQAAKTGMENLGENIVWQKYLPGEIILNVENVKPAILFLANNFFPGWEATVNGQKTEIYRANYTFQAVALPEGISEVKFIYRPFSFRLGIFISIGFFLLYLVTVFISILFRYPINFSNDR